MGSKGKVIGDFFDALIARGDMDAARGLMADDFRLTYGGTSSIAGAYKGADEFFGLFGKIMEMTGGTYTPAMHDIADSDDHAVAMVDISAQRGGKSFSYKHIVVWHVEDGKVKEGFAMDSDDDVVKELFA